MYDKVVAKVIKPGAVGVIPTDTVYGLVCRAADKVAVARLYSVKHRDSKPGTIIAANIDQIVELGIPRRYVKAVEQFWPGAVSVKIPSDIQYLTLGVGDIAVRIPGDEELRLFLEKTGPLQTTSANLPGDPTATTVQIARNCFGDTVDYYLDGGDLSGRQPSTVIRIVDDAIEVVREGAVKIEENE